jgi:UPF0042 nucleotide-binding protein
MRLVIITGMSGSGKSTAARALEDEGFFVVDNLPLILLPDFLRLAEQEGGTNSSVAIVIDVRNRDFLGCFQEILQKVRDAGHLVEICFFDAADEDLIRRYSETRRRHPLILTAGIPAAISKERQLMAGLKNLATVVFDSSGLTVHQLRRKFVKYIHGSTKKVPLVVHLQSFGFRYGIPLESDLVMDVRFLPNPHFVEELKPLTGLDRAVAAYLFSQQVCCDFLRRFRDLLSFLLPQYQREGKSYFTISVGCTGGRHRSVAIVEELRPCFSGEGITLEMIHRDISKG